MLLEFRPRSLQQLDEDVEKTSGGFTSFGRCFAGELLWEMRFSGDLPIAHHRKTNMDTQNNVLEKVAPSK